mgnify:FL=1
MTVGTTPRDVVDELLGPPVGEVVTAIAEDSDTAALTAQLERELDRRPDAPAHRVHAIDDARSAAAAVVALRKEPRAIHIFRLADGARRDLLSLLDRRRSTLALATLLLVGSPTAFAEQNT